MAATPNLAATPRCGFVQIATANTARDGTGTLGTVITAGASGSRIDAIHIKAQGTTTAGMVRFYINDGTNTRFWREVPVPALTPSASLTAFYAAIDLALQPLILPAGYSLKASTNNAEVFNLFAMGGDF
jgi:hypothetical protein